MSRRELLGAGLSVAAVAMPLGEMPETRQRDLGEDRDAEIVRLYEKWRHFDEAELQADFRSDDLWHASKERMPTNIHSQEYREARDRLGLSALDEEAAAAGEMARKAAKQLIATPATTIQGLYLKLLAAEGIDLNSEEAKVLSGPGYEGRDLVLSALADAKRMSQN